MAMTAAIFLYSSLDPADSVYWPKCPFFMLTGLECPGCGAQRAIHSLLNGDFVSALHFNVLTVIAIPYLLLYALLLAAEKIFPGSRSFCRKPVMTFYHGPALWVILGIVLAFWLFRNFTPLF